MRRLRQVPPGLTWLTARSIAALVAAVAAVVSLAVAVPQVARAQGSQFPIDEPFSGSKPNNPNWKLTDEAQLTDNAPGNAGWLELTSVGTSQRGAAFLNEAYPSDLGIVVDFQYATYGGTGADGFTFFLVNGSSPPSVGGVGGALGYSGPAGTGIDGGYVGVGFDEYGNFSVPASSGNNTGPGKKPQAVAVRGAAPGYGYLAGVSPAGGVATGNNTTGVRSVQITILPNAAGIPLLSVMSNTGAGTPLKPVITDLALSAPLPPTFKLGFAASTGDKTDVHEIRDLTVRVPADVSIVKQGPEEAPQGGSVGYTLLVTGNGPNPVFADDPALIVDDVPSVLTNVRWECLPGAGAVCLAPTSGTGNDVTARVAFPDQRGVGTARIAITGTVVPDAMNGARITNDASVVMPPDREQVGHAGSSVDTTIVNSQATPVPAPSANLSVDNTVDNASPELGQDVTFTVTVTNHGPDNTFSTLVHDLLPAGLDYVSDDAAASDGTYEPLGGVWDVGPLTAGQTKTLHITVSAQNTKTAFNAVTSVESDLPDSTPCPPDCGPDASVTTRFALLLLAKTSTPLTTVPDGLITYHLSVTNVGDAPDVAVTLTDKLPPEVSYVSDDSGGTYDPGTGTWSVGSLAVAKTAHLDITVHAHASSVNAVVEATSPVPDPEPCLPLPTPSLPPPQVTRPFGCPPVVIDKVTLLTVPVTG